MGVFGDDRPKMRDAHHGPNQRRHRCIGAVQNLDKSGNYADALSLNLVQSANPVFDLDRTESRHQLKQVLTSVQHVARPTYRR
jgi:hypothetical protein